MALPAGATTITSQLPRIAPELALLRLRDPAGQPAMLFVFCARIC